MFIAVLSQFGFGKSRNEPYIESGSVSGSFGHGLQGLQGVSRTLQARCKAGNVRVF
jgi:hypothetical protein